MKIIAKLYPFPAAFHSLTQYLPLLNTYIARCMHGLECLDFQLYATVATCLEVRTSCYRLPVIAGPCSTHTNTYLGRAKERWMQSLASEQATSECACAICHLTYIFTEHAHH